MSTMKILPQQQRSANRNVDGRRLKRIRRCFQGVLLTGLLVGLYFNSYVAVKRTSKETTVTVKLFGSAADRPPSGVGEEEARGQQQQQHQSRLSWRRPPPSYQLWDHVTSTIDLPPDLYRTERGKPTSLELLQDVLRENDQPPGEDDVGSASSSSSSSSQLGYPSCFEPNLASTVRLVERIVTEQRRNNNNNASGNDDTTRDNNDNDVTAAAALTVAAGIMAGEIGLPILNMGMPKSGSTTLRNFFRRVLGWNASHYGVPSTEATAKAKAVGQEMMRAVADGAASPFAYVDPTGYYQAHTQMDYTGLASNIFPQIQLLDEIHVAHPHATFVLLFRPVRDWVRSTQGWHKYPFRWANTGPGQDVPGLVLTPEQRQARDVRGERIVLTEGQLTDWWCHHVRHVRKFVETYPTHPLIELDLYDADGTTTEVLTKLFGVDDIRFKRDSSTPIWGTSNRNPSKRGSSHAIQRTVKYYELWNHTTHAMPKLPSAHNGTKDDGTDHIPTSFEILEQVMREYDGGDGNRQGKDESSSCFRAKPFDGDTTSTSVNISFPVLHMGLPLVGNEFLKGFFRDCILGATIHGISKKVKGGGLVGKKMMEAVHAGLPPVSAYFGTSESGENTASRQLAFTQLDYTSVLPRTGSSIFEQVADAAQDYSAFPQIQLLDEIHEDVPHATFVLLFRGGSAKKGSSSNFYNNSRLEEWIEVAQNFHNFTERWAAMDDVPGLVLSQEQKVARDIVREQQRQEPRFYNISKKNENDTSITEPMEKLTDDQLRDWWCRHVQHVRKFVEFHPTHKLLELDLQDQETSTAVLLQWFPETNVTCLADLWKETDFL